jgi:adenylate cyclase
VDVFRTELDNDLRSILDGAFRVTISSTNTVPSVDDPALTYPNLDTGEQRCKLLESCILHVDIRDSTAIGAKHRRETLVGLYSAFVRAMSKSAAFYNGRVRNIIGDRVMVLFDRQNCFSNAVCTAILMNSVAKYMLDTHFKHNDIRCGIGIDYGPMLIAKAGVIKRGMESPASRSLVWLGRPANVASKLADEANKFDWWSVPMVQEGYFDPYLRQLIWIRVPESEFLHKIQPTYSQFIRHQNEAFSTFFQSEDIESEWFPPILMTREVLQGLISESALSEKVRTDFWKEQDLTVSGYAGTIYGGDVIFPALRGY